MPHDIDRPGPLPKLVRSGCRVFGIRMETERHAGVRTIKVNGSELGFGSFDQRIDLRFLGDVAKKCGAAERRCHRAGGLEINIRDDDLFRASLVKCLTESAADSAASACY